VTTTLLALAIMSGLGAFFGAGLAVAHRFLKVEEDPRLEILDEMLPNSNCGACGEAGCRAFAEQLVGGAVKPSRCTVSSPGAIDSIASFLGVEAGSEEKRVARLHGIRDHSGVGSLDVHSLGQRLAGSQNRPAQIGRVDQDRFEGVCLGWDWTG